MTAIALVKPTATNKSLPADNGHRTARRALDQLCQADPRYHSPTRAERTALMVAFAARGRTLHPAAFDAIRFEQSVDLTDPAALSANLDAITICEIKSTNQNRIGADLRGYFFNVTAAELLSAQSLGTRYCFVFVNTLTGDHQEMGLNEIFGRARATYPAWHIRF